MNEIAKFSILDEKNQTNNFGRNLDENGQLIDKKIVKFFHIHWHYHNVFIVGLKERMPIELLRCEWINFFHKTSECTELLGVDHIVTIICGIPVVNAGCTIQN